MSERKMVVLDLTLDTARVCVTVLESRLADAETREKAANEEAAYCRTTLAEIRAKLLEAESETPLNV